MTEMMDAFLAAIKDKPQFREKQRTDAAVIIVAARPAVVPGDADPAAKPADQSAE
jgi:hypothetical protein